MLQGSLVCSGIDPIIAVKDYWCVSYNPSDPICGQYQKPICSDLVENQSVACTLPHYSGVINQNRTYSCATNSWSPWIEASNNCTPDPPTCQASLETRQLACQADYVGSVTEAPKIEVPKGKELVPGFGIVLSLDILNKPLVQQIQITDAFKFEQGLNDDIGKTQNFQLELIQLGTSQGDLDSFANSSWKRLHRYNLME